MIDVPNEIVTQKIAATLDTFLPHGAGAMTALRLHTALSGVAHVAGAMTALRLHTALSGVAHVAYREGKHDALMGLRTAEQLAIEFNVSPRRMRAIIEAQHGRWATGMKIGSTWVVSADEIESVRPGPVGRPAQMDMDDETAAMIADPALMAALADQDERLAAIVTAIHVDGATLADVAARLNVSQERARQLRAQGLRRLRGIAAKPA